MNKKAVIYCRVSTKEQVDEGNSLHSQEKLCREYCHKNGFEIAETFIDQGESAKTANRPELQHLLEYCTLKKNDIGAVVIYKLDRISRNTDDYSKIRLLLKKYGVEIKSITEYFDTTSPAGKFMENMIVNVGQFDNDVKIERCIGGMRNAMQDGRYVWLAPLGYDNAKLGGRSNIIPNALAPMVTKAFETVALQKEVSQHIREQLAKQGLVTKKGKPLARSQFDRMLRNEAYAGWIRKFGERHKGLYEPLISDALFERVQWVLRRKGRKAMEYIRENPDFPLRRFVTHKTGETLTGGWTQGRSKKYPYYRFNKLNVGYKKEVLEQSFKEFMNQCKLDELDYKVFMASAKRHLIKENQDKLREARELKTYITDLEDKKRDLLKKNIKGLISEDIVHEHLALIKEEILNTEIALSTLPNVEADFAALLKFIEAYLKNPGDTWEKAPFRLRLELQWFNFPKGVVIAEENFCTAEVASIYKVNDLFLPATSLRVPISRKSLNQSIENKGLNVQNYATDHEQSTYPVNVSNNLNSATTILWKQVGQDIVRLADILKRNE